MIINKVTHEKKSRLIRIDYFEDNIEKILLISPTDIIKDWQAAEHRVQSDGLWDCANCDNRQIGSGFAECPNCETARR